MKNSIAYILILAFGASALFNAFVVGDYFLRFDYYETVLCENQDLPELNCHGTCHLKAELTKDDSKKQLPPLAEFKIQAIEDSEKAFVQYCLSDNTSKIFSELKENIPSSDFYLSIYHPPENSTC